MTLEQKTKVSLVQLQRELNKEMRCPAGQNQVYILTRMKTNGRIRKESPQVCLDCKIRSFLGWRKKVFQEYIEKVCTQDYKHRCEAYQTFMARRRNSFLVPK